jgi:hypothetical protein
MTKSLELIKRTRLRQFEQIITSLKSYDKEAFPLYLMICLLLGLLFWHLLLYDFGLYRQELCVIKEIKGKFLLSNLHYSNILEYTYDSNTYIDNAPAHDNYAQDKFILCYISYIGNYSKLSYTMIMTYILHLLEFYLVINIILRIYYNMNVNRYVKEVKDYENYYLEKFSQV